MKVVLFCGGLGMRMREYSEAVPKPMVPIGYRPILWHLMRYYAHYGHKDFVLCLGYRGDSIKRYFLDYSETLTNDFVLMDGGRRVDLLGTDISDWTITFVDTGLHTTIAGRLMAARRHLEGEEMFLANYADGLTDLDLGPYVAEAEKSEAVATFLSIRPNQSYHLVEAEADGRVRRMRSYADADIWINFGYFVLRRAIFDYIRPGEELVMEPFYRLIAEGRLSTRRHTGFAASMDTYKEMQTLNDIHAAGEAPWEVWHKALEYGA